MLLAAYWFPNLQRTCFEKGNFLVLKQGIPITNIIMKLTDALLQRVPLFPSISQSASMSPSRYLGDPFQNVPSSPSVANCPLSQYQWVSPIFQEHIVGEEMCSPMPLPTLRVDAIANTDERE